MAPQSTTVASIRGILLAALVLGLVGTVVELFLLEHTEDAPQWIPIVLMFVALIVLGWHGLARDALTVRAIQVTMVAFIAAGVLGVILHYRGNIEFELELHPGSRGGGLFLEALHGATPALAPGMMVQMGLIGLAYTFRHPWLGATTEDGPAVRELSS
jgi:hypothetical protein